MKKTKRQTQFCDALAKLDSIITRQDVIDAKLDEVLLWFRRKYIQPVQSRRANNEKLESLRDKVDELLKRTAPNETKPPLSSQIVAKKMTPSIYDTAPRSYAPHVPIVDKNLGTLR